MIGKPARNLLLALLLAAIPSMLMGCSACGGKSREKTVEMEIALPLTAEQAAAIEGIRAGVRGISRIDENARETQPGVLTRLDPRTMRTVGLTIIDFRKRFAAKPEEAMPVPLVS